jgi:L-malate glycosyltransferase
MYPLIILKRRIEDLFILPFVLWGRMKARRKPLNRAYDVFFFFPFHHTGGAEKVHAMIANALKHKKALIVFTRRSTDQAFLDDFRASGHDIMDVSAFTDNKARYWNNLVYRGIFSGYIHAQRIPTLVFNGQSNFGYKLSPWIRSSVPQVELIHSFSSFSYIRVPFLPFYRETVMISRRRIEDHIAMYRRWMIPSRYDQRIRYIMNGIPLPGKTPRSPRAGSWRAGSWRAGLGFMFVGRGTAEKRPALAAAIARQLQQNGLPITMTFVGDLAAAIPDALKGKDAFIGPVGDARELEKLYREKADVLLVTSSEEGFPLVVMEAMAQGSVIMGTPVGDMPVHITPGVNGFLFSSVHDESIILREAETFTRQLLNDPGLVERISAGNIEYAYGNFGLANFEKNYRELIETYLP